MRRWMLIAVLAGLVGCDDNSSSKPAVLPTPQTSPAAQAAPDAAAPNAAAPNSAAPSGVSPSANPPGANTPADAGITWQLPQGWAQREGSNMRIATLTSDTGVEVSVTGFGGQAGGLTMNVNRWRGQLELPPLAEADVPGATQKAPIANGAATLVDITGTGAEPQRVVAAIVPGAGKTFFFKMTGPAKRIEEAKAGFLALLKTVKPEAAQ